MTFKLVTNKLGLNESATEDNILRAIQDIENKAATESSRLNTALNEAANDFESETKDAVEQVQKVLLY